MFGQNRSNRMPNNGPMPPPDPRPLGPPMGGPNGPIGPNFPNGPMLRMDMGPPPPGFGINPQGPFALTVHHPRSLIVEKSYISNYEETINFEEMTVFQISSTNHFGGRIIFRRKDEEFNDKQLSYTELVIQGIHGRGYESNRNDLQLVFEKRNTNEEVIFDVTENPDLNDARGEEPKAEPSEAGVSGVSNKRKRR